MSRPVYQPNESRSSTQSYKSVDMSRYKMMLIGEVGSGKTSLLNYLCNVEFIQSPRIENFQNVALQGNHAQKIDSPQSCEVKMYGEVVHIIDTPGFGDCRGFRQDIKNECKIVETLTSEEYINCICLVINGRLPSMSPMLQYVLTEITGILPKNVINNIIVVFTNCSDILDLTFDSGLLQEFFGKQFNDDHIFYLENPYCRLEKAREKKEKLNNISHKKIAAGLRRSFEKAGEMLEEMLRVIFSFTAVFTLQFGELYKKKQVIGRHISDLLAEYEYQKQLETVIEAKPEMTDTNCK